MLPLGLANRKRVEVPVQHEPAAGARPPNPHHEIDQRLLAHHPAMLDAGRAVEHGLDRFDHGGGVARRIGAVDAHQRAAQLYELPGPRLDARREARLGGAGAHGRPRVAAARAGRSRILVATPAAGCKEQVQRGGRCRNSRRPSAGDAGGGRPTVVVLAVEEYERQRHSGRGVRRDRIEICTTTAHISISCRSPECTTCAVCACC